MDIKPIDSKTNFGIYKYSKAKPYGELIIGRYKNYNIEIYDAKRDNQKLFYISRVDNSWVKSKLVYFVRGIKKIIRSKSNGMQR